MRESFSPKVVFEDENLLVVDKPSGLVVNKAETANRQITVQDWIEKNFKFLPRRQTGQISNFEFAPDFVRRAGIVHRLDKETSGLLLIAKTPKVFVELQRQFKERKVEKKYLALVHGRMEPAEGKIEAPVGRNPFNREKFGVVLGGREALTFYKVLDRKETFSLLELFPRTGRTHQLRVHLQYIGHPVVADDKYAGRKTLRADKKWCPRLFLHASYLAFNYPPTGARVEFKSDLPADLQQVLGNVNWKSG